MCYFSCISLVIVVAIGGAYAMKPPELGMTMAVRAYDVVCWYEKLRKFPDTDSKGFSRDCLYKAEHVKKSIKSDDMRKYFGFFLYKVAMDGIPKEYKETCTEYLKEPEKDFTKDESTVLNDGNKGLKYPFRGFSYCLMSKLREKYGNEAMELVKTEKTFEKKHWMTVILERQNQFRVKHGADPLKLVQELMDAAQTRAEVMATSCKLIGSAWDDKERQWKKSVVGESSVAGPEMPEEDAALVAANILYEEVGEYPFDEGGYKGNGYDEFFSKIGHFTQLVWKHTKYVGYGFALAENCESNFKWVMVIKYFPSGNYPGKFQDNVQNA